MLKSAINDSVLKIEAAQNIIVIKTHPGIANAVAVGIDSLDVHGLVGSVAGDDTILMVVRDLQTAQSLKNELKSSFGI